MKKILSLLCAVLMIASLACFSAFADDAAAVTVAAVAHDVTVGDTQLVVDFVLNVPTDVTLQGFAVNFQYDKEVMTLVEASDYNIKGQGIYGQNYTDMPYNLVWAGIDRDAIKGSGEDLVILSLTFDLAAPATEGAEYTVNIACTDLKDSNDNSLEGSAVIKNASAVAAVATTAPVTTEPAPTETATEAPATSATEAPATTKAATEAPATTTTEAPATTKAPDKASQTGDMMFVVVAVMVVALGAAVVVKKVNVK